MTMGTNTLIATLIGMALALLLIACTPVGPEGAAQDPTPEPEPTETAVPTTSPDEPDITGPEMENSEIDDINWSLIHTVVGGDAVVPAPDFANPRFTITEGMVAGDSGCNTFRGSITVEGDTISFGPLATTRMACDPERMTLEDTVLNILESAATFTLSGDTLELQDADGLPLAQFVAAEEKTLYVGPEQVDCVGVAPQRCLLVKEDPDAEYEFFYDSIAGFEWETGYEYELLVGVTEVQEPPADSSSLRYKLIEIVRMEPVTPDALTGTLWQWVRFEDSAGINNIEVDDPARYTIQFMADGTYAIQADCNRGSGNYTVEASSLNIQPGPMTLAACGETSLDGDFLRLLGDVVTFVLAEDSTLFLNLKADAGNMVFSAAE